MPGTNPKRKVLFFLPSSTGGAERMTITIAKMLDRELFDVKFVIVHRSLGTIVKFIPDEYPVLHIPVHNIWCFATWRMTKLIRKERPDVVFCSLRYLSARMIIAAKIVGGVKIIVRSDNALKTLRCDNRFLIQKTFPYADWVIAQQDEMRQELIDKVHLSPQKVITLYNPIDYLTIDSKSKAPSPYTNADNHVKYVWVGRFHYNKGQDLLVRAFKSVHEKNPDAHLYLIGMYDWKRGFDKGVKEFVEENDLSENVHFVGFDDNPYRWVKYSDCFVMPSRLEGLPNSLIEAMYLKCPVVAARCIPAIDRIVKEGYNGYIVPNEDVEAMAEAMIKALSLRDFDSNHYKPAIKEDFTQLFTL